MELVFLKTVFSTEFISGLVRAYCRHSATRLLNTDMFFPMLTLCCWSRGSLLVSLVFWANNATANTTLSSSRPINTFIQNLVVIGMNSYEISGVCPVAT